MRCRRQGAVVIPVRIEKRLVLRAKERIPLEKPGWARALGKPGRTKGHQVVVGDKNLAVAIPPSFEEEQQGIDQTGETCKPGARGLDLDAYLGQNRRLNRTPFAFRKRNQSFNRSPAKLNRVSTLGPENVHRTVIGRENLIFFSLARRPEFSLANRPNRPQPKKGMKQNEDHGLTFAPTMKKTIHALW